MKTVHQLLETKGNAVYSVSGQATVYEALVILAEKHIGAITVVDDGKLVGILSERDYAREVIVKGKSSKTTRVEEIMSTQLVTVTSHQTVEECMNLMSERRIRHLPVVDDGKLVGILSIGDLVKETIAYQQFLIKQLESYIQG
ncbi:CBS domain-containing protein [Pseudomethylobacillus aquaticus]|uniref:CBS domain-containing protein n=1 Tax=Pseudomethylobacillus aquaticus TaxID=2676064 RepID=A0A3N0V2L2_9PROT|nr:MULTISPECIES: CBS domain-containing protein [Methylophilaceae]ROH87046.1 CBS domain-containing protein [Pseudomethylobacillus aquaticus]